MKPIKLEDVLAETGGDADRRLSLFAMLNLGLVEMLSEGALSATDSTRLFFNAENCAFVRKQLGSKDADKVMSHGVQLPDLFDTLPPAKAQQEFQRELTAIRKLCLRMMEKGKLAVGRGA
jgi:hypothetical protein